MRVTRRTAILSTLGIGVAAKVPEPTPVLDRLRDTAAIAESTPRGMTLPAGWCAPSEAIYDAHTWVAEAFPIVSVKRGGVRFGP